VELTQRFARAKAFTHVLLLKSPQEIRPTIDEQKALLLVRFPADFSRNLDTNQTAPLQLCSTGATPTARKSPPTTSSRSSKTISRSCWKGKRSRTTASWWCATGITRISITNGSWCRR
jgi:ABC-2 type transport system permease protein